MKGPDTGSAAGSYIAMALITAAALVMVVWR